MNDSSNVPLLIAGFFLLFGMVAFGLCLFFFLRNRAKITSIESAQAVDVGDLDDGYWKTSGRVVALEEPLVSPMTRTECVFFLFRVEELKTRTVSTYDHQSRGRRTGTRTETYWETVVTDRQAITCAVKDKTGSARIELSDAETVFSPSAHSTSGTFQNCPERLQRTLSKRYGFATKGLIFNKGLRYTETVIEEGDKLFVIGDVEIGRGGAPVFVRGDKPFIVSDRSEAKLLAHFRTRATWSLVGAVLVGVLTPVLAALPVLMTKSQPGRNDANPLAAPRDGRADPGRPPQNNPVVPGPNNLPRPPQNNPALPPAPGANNPRPDPITQALTELRSPDPLARARGAVALVNTVPEPARRDEVLSALRPVTTDADFHARTWALKAVEAWEKPGPTAERPNPVQEGHHYRQDPIKELPAVAVPWTAALDPLPAPPGAPGKAWPVIPLGFLHKTVRFPALPSSFVAVNPKQPTGQPEVEGLTQVYNLQTGRATGKPFVAKVALGERFALSSDGGYLAGRVTGGPSEATIEVIESATGRSVRRIEAGRGKDFAFPIGFVGADRLLTMTHEGRFPDAGEKTEYKVWDVRTGDVLSEFSFDLVYHTKWAGLSGGGRYLVFQEARTVIGQRLVIFDLTTGKVAGDVMLQPKSEPFGQAAGIVFSPDGKEFAMLWRLGKRPDLWGQVLVFDAATGTRLATHKLGYEMKNFDSLWSEGGPDCIQWVPDGSGWLICGHLVVDRKTGAVTGRIGAEPKWHGEMPPRRFVGPGLVTTTVTSGLDTGLTLEPVRPGGR